MGNSTLAERLDLAMKGPPKVRQADLARACGVRPPSVTDWLNGRTKRLEGANLLNAARKLGVTPEWLATGRGAMRPHGRTETNQPHEVPPTSQPLTLDADILHEALTLLFYDEGVAGPYAPRAKSERVAELYRRLAADGGRLSSANNAAFVEEVERRGKRGATEGSGRGAGRNAG